MINDADFKERLKILSEFITQDDKETYENYRYIFMHQIQSIMNMIILEMQYFY